MCNDDATYQRAMSNMQRDRPKIHAAINSNPPAFMNMVRKAMADPAALARAVRPLAPNEVGVTPKDMFTI